MVHTVTKMDAGGVIILISANRKITAKSAAQIMVMPVNTINVENKNLSLKRLSRLKIILVGSMGFN
jgi:hypothetical protein